MFFMYLIWSLEFRHGVPGWKLFCSFFTILLIFLCSFQNTKNYLYRRYTKWIQANLTRVILRNSLNDLIHDVKLKRNEWNANLTLVFFCGGYTSKIIIYLGFHSLIIVTRVNGMCFSKKGLFFGAAQAHRKSQEGYNFTSLQIGSAQICHIAGYS